MNTNENQPPTTAEIVKKLRDNSDPLDAVEYYEAGRHAADRLEAQERELTELRRERDKLKTAHDRFEKCFVRIAQAHGIDSPLVLMGMAENNEENLAEILARFVEKRQAAHDAAKAREDGR